MYFGSILPVLIAFYQSFDQFPSTFQKLKRASSEGLAQNQSTERSLKVLDDILHVLYTYREPDEPWRNPGCSPLFVALVSMYHGSRMRDQCLHPSQTHGQQA